MDLSFLKDIVVFVTDLVANVGYPGLFGMILLESTGTPVPGQVGIFFGGYLAQTGRMSLVGVVLAATAGHTCGTSLVYWLSRRLGRRGLERYGRYVFISSQQVDRAEAWFARHGNWSLVLGQLTPYVRDYVSYPAGILKMPYRRFLPVVLATTFAWNLGSAYVGYVVASHWRELAESIGRYFVIWMAAVALLGLVVFVLVPRIRSSRAPQTIEDS